jgi:signal transduction histidine kinase
MARSQTLVGPITGQRNGQAHFTVRNDGPLLHQDEVDRHYEPFRRHGTERTATNEVLCLACASFKPSP